MRPTTAPPRLLPRLAAFFLVLVPAALAGASPAAAAESRRPNLLFLLTDDQRFDTLGCMGNRTIQTPHIDHLAAEGVTFDNAFATTAICAISRASYLTGQYERRHRIADFATMLSPQAWQQSFPALLKKQGYRLGFIGKWGVGRDLPKDQYDYWRGFAGQGRYFTPGDDEHLTDKHSRMALEFLDGCTAEQPFCLQISFKASHCQDGEPWQTQFPPAKRYAPLYADVKLPVPVTANEAAFRLLPECLQNSEARRRWHVRFANPEMHQYTLRNYYRLITGVDDTVGRIVDKLAAKGLADNTVIVYASDHGFYLGDRGLAGKWFIHEESIRIPMLIYDPRIPRELRGRRRAEQVLNIDVAPTLLDYAGVEPPAAMQGKSLRPLAEGEQPAWRHDWLYEHRFQHARIPQSEGVRTERWKYVRYPQQKPLVEELFDLAEDPHELHDLSGSKDHRETLEKLRRRCDELIAEAR